MQAGLNASVSQFRQEFYRELTQVAYDDRRVGKLRARAPVVRRWKSWSRRSALATRPYC